MKKKILSLCLVAIVAIMAVTGASLAYLTDTDSEDNVFTVGNVEIDLTENFTTDENGLAKLMPAVGSAQDGTLRNGITKEVFVTNTGSEDAYVRVHIAIPTLLDNGRPDFDASQNVLHFNYDSDNIGENKWDWSNAAGAPYSGEWNFYETTIAGVAYNVYVVTYEKKLTASEVPLADGEITVSAMNQVYLDSKVTNEDITKLKEALGDNWHIYVVAEGTQAAGFDDAYTALNTSFGTPGSYDIEWPVETTTTTE